jgi:hypothetical protein
MSAAERYEPALGHKRRVSPEQQRWPTLGWALGELRWYLLGATIGGGLAISAFAAWLALVQLRVI